MSGAGIMFELEKGGNVGPLLILGEGGTQRLEVIMKLPGVANNKSISKVSRDDLAHLSVSLDEKDVLTASGGEKSRRAKLKNPKIVRRQIHCQSGTFEFDMNPKPINP